MRASKAIVAYLSVLPADSNPIEKYYTRGSNSTRKVHSIFYALCAVYTIVRKRETMRWIRTETYHARDMVRLYCLQKGEKQREREIYIYIYSPFLRKDIYAARCFEGRKEIASYYFSIATPSFVARNLEHDYFSTSLHRTSWQAHCVFVKGIMITSRWLFPLAWKLDRLNS